MRFQVEARQARPPIPNTVFGRDWTNKLYARFHSLANKARKKEYAFSWDSFSEFLVSLEKVAPEDYHPETHRFNFDLEKVGEDGKPLGYCLETMRVQKTSVKEEKQKNGTQVLSEVEKLLFMGELTKLMLGGYNGTLDELVSSAKSQAGIK